MGRMTNIGEPAGLLADPANFLHAIDVEGGHAYFVRTNAELLRTASFVDGRVPMATSEPFETPLPELIAAAPDLGVATDRFVFNCSFCGSTLLGRLLDVPGRSLVLKEPRALTDIAAWKSLNTRDGVPSKGLRPLLDMAKAVLRRPFQPGEPVTVKVASQGNLMADQLVEDAAHAKPVFITISRFNFLRAVFRGGADRMNYAARIAWHMATEVPNGDAMLQEASRMGGDPLRKAANMAVLASSFQINRFERATKVGHWGKNHLIDYETIAKSPHEAAAKAARALDIPISDADIERNVERLANVSAKQPNEAFSSDQQQAVDNQLYAEHRQVFDDALKWADRTLGPQDGDA